MGAGVFGFLSFSLLRRGWGEAGRVIYLSLFAFCSIFLFSVSGVYHLLGDDNPGRIIFQRLDHAAIFALIAGTFTPIHGILFKGIARWGSLSFVWLAAATGMTMKTIFFSQIGEWMGLLFYLGLGWIGVLSVTALWSRFGFYFVRPLILGGLVYTLGAILEFSRWPILIPGVVASHELFHVAVLVGVGLHWGFVSDFVRGGSIQAATV